jgi:hypothetical protein
MCALLVTLLVNFVLHCQERITEMSYQFMYGVAAAKIVDKPSLIDYDKTRP